MSEKERKAKNNNLPKKEHHKEEKTISVTIYIVSLLTLFVLAIICLVCVRNYYKKEIDYVLKENSPTQVIDIEKLLNESDNKVDTNNTSNTNSTANATSNSTSNSVSNTASNATNTNEVNTTNAVSE